MKNISILLAALLTTATAQQPKTEPVNDAAAKLIQSQMETDAKLRKEMQELGATSVQMVQRVEKATAPVVAAVKKESNKAVQAAQTELPAVTDAVVECKRAQTALVVGMLSGLRRVADGVAKQDTK